MSNKVGIPYFPTPPREYRPDYMAQVVRSFASFAQAVQNPGEGRNSTLVLTGLQQNDVGLEVGAIYQQGNQLFITVLHITAPAGVEATGSVGTVTVVTT